MKKLLILGGTSASYDLVKLAQAMGVYVIVTDEADVSERVAKQIADETAMISTDDIEQLAAFVREKEIDGAFCGPSEFNIINLINLCEATGLPCYASSAQWDLCSNKETFKQYCIKHDVPTATEYAIECFRQENMDKAVSYPVIVKPVDGCSSKGISICHDREAVLKAYEFALNASKSKRVVIEQYIDNGGSIFSFRYILDNGKYYPYLMFDTYIADPVDKKCLISAFTYYPSEYMPHFYEELDQNVQKMFADMGLENGVAFVQSIPYKGKIYCHEMGFRLSGGMIYKLTQRLMGINDMEMMLRYALGEPIVTESELARIDLKHNTEVLAQLMIPLECGTIQSIEGLEEILKMPNIIDFLQYYREGETVPPELYGTLAQHFGRFTLAAKSKEEMLATVDSIQKKLRISDCFGNDMYKMKFDINRVH